MNNHIRTCCPSCSGRIKIPIRLIAKRVKCTKCNYAFVADLAFSPVEPPDPPVVQSPRMPAATKPAPADHRQSTPPPAPNRRRGSSASVPPPSPQPEPTDTVGDDDVLHPITYKPQRQISPTHASPGPAPKAVYLVLRLLFQWILPVVLAIVGLLAIAVVYKYRGGLSPIAFLAFVPAILIFFLGDFLARLFTAAWAKTYACPGCHSIFEAVDRWRCGCGYTDHKDRHFMRFRCPMCGKRVGHTNCRCCQATIFLQWGLKKPGRG